MQREADREAKRQEDVLLRAQQSGMRTVAYGVVDNPYIRDILRDGDATDCDVRAESAWGQGAYMGVFSGVRCGVDGGVLTDYYNSFPTGQVVQFTVQQCHDFEQSGEPIEGSVYSKMLATVYTKQGVCPMESLGNIVRQPGRNQFQYSSRYRRRCGDAHQMISKYLCRFPDPPAWEVPIAMDLYQPDIGCDVYVMNTSAHAAEVVHKRMTKLAAKTNDHMVPKYQNVIDPNLFVHKGRWVASEWDISADGVPHIVGGSKSHIYSDEVDRVFTPLLAAALPVLTKLQRPALHLPNLRLQAVPKAQRIIVPPKGVRLEGEEGSSGGEYQGLWHVDGDVEDIVAVVLYYHNVDSALEGGMMEFMSRDAIIGDTYELDSSIREGIHGCKVPIETGTILIFSNYQMIHRVLRMVNTSDAEASRDFVALFIVNPAGEKLASAERFLASEDYKNQTDESKKQTRLTKLTAQLTPAGSFGKDEVHHVWSTGNGCFYMMRFLEKQLEESALQVEDTDSSEDPREAAVNKYTSLTLPPNQVNRGTSELLSASTASREDRAEAYYWNHVYSG